MDKKDVVYTHRVSLIAQLIKNRPAMQETPVRFLGWEDLLEKGQDTHSSILGLPCGSAGKESTCNAGDLGSIPDWEDPLEKEKATHSSILSWRVPWTVWGRKESDMTE